MKKAAYYIIISLLLLATGCSSTSSKDSSSKKMTKVDLTLATSVPSNSPQLKTPDPFSKGVKITQSNMELEQIAKIVLENQLQYIERSDYPEEGRIKDFKINKIKIEKSSNTGFMFFADYSVLPATSNYVLAGNGIIDEQSHWINNKTHFIDVSNTAGTYTIVSMATGR